MKGGKVREHFAVTMEPREATALAQVLKDARGFCREGKFNLNELEDETSAAFIQMIEDGGQLVAD